MKKIAIYVSFGESEIKPFSEHKPFFEHNFPKVFEHAKTNEGERIDKKQRNTKETQKKQRNKKKHKTDLKKSDVQNDRDRIDRSHARRRSKAAKELAKKVGEQHWQVPLK